VSTIYNSKDEIPAHTGEARGLVDLCPCDFVRLSFVFGTQQQTQFTCTPVGLTQNHL
jgi:hypothetical protein